MIPLIWPDLHPPTRGDLRCFDIPPAFKAAPPGATGRLPTLPRWPPDLISVIIEIVSRHTSGQWRQVEAFSPALTAGDRLGKRSVRKVFDILFYRPTRKVYDSPEAAGLTYMPVRFTTTDGLSLHGWFLPAVDRARGTILHLHGNAGNITAHFRNVAWLPAHGWNAFCFDYRGYGQSPGRISREGSIRDAHAALDHLLSRDDVNPDGIVAFGQSLGGAVGTVLTAERKEIRGLAVDGCFDSYRGIVRWHMERLPLIRHFAEWLSRLMIRSGCDPIDAVSRISPRPLLIIHGTADTIVPASMGRNLFRQAGEPKELWLIEDMDHYQALFEMPGLVCPKLLAFFESCLAGGRVRPASHADVNPPMARAGPAAPAPAATDRAV